MGRQTRIPGIDKKHPDVSAAAVDYVEQRDARMKLTEREVEAKERLLDVMREHGLKVYEDPDEGLRVECTETTRVKVRRVDEESTTDAEQVGEDDLPAAARKPAAKKRAAKRGKAAAK